MKKSIVAAAVLAVLLLAPSTPVAAQEGEQKTYSLDGYATSGPGQPGDPTISGIPDYEFRGGLVYIDGDMAVNCEGFARGIDRERTAAGDVPAAALKALDGCEKAGLLSPKPAASVRASTDEPPGSGGDELPDTGGPDAGTLLAVSAVLLASVLVARKVVG